MLSHESRPSLIVRRTVAVALVIFALIGVILLLISSAISHTHEVWQTFTRELGIVLLTVCGISMIYELFVAEKHFKQFAAALRQQIEQGETNAAMCERLGIIRIYPGRSPFETDYPFAGIAAAVTDGVRLRIVAKSLFFVMIKSVDIRLAVERGAVVELCCLHPNKISPALSAAGLHRRDIEAALERFKYELVDWAERAQPSGTIELRYHDVDLFDSYFGFQLEGRELGAWDLSFGSDVTDKRILLLDVKRGLGRLINKRYGSVWEAAEKKFLYHNHGIHLNELGLDG